MMGKYLVKRLSIFFITLLAATSINFIIPRITPQDPIAALMGKLAAKGQVISNSDKLMNSYREKFGFDEPLPVQYIKYLANVFRGDLGYSLSYYPGKVTDIILRAIPWSMGLLFFANLAAFIIGSLLGAVCSWKRTPSLVKVLVYIVMPLSVIPFYMLAMMILYLFAVIFPLFPIGGAYTAGTAGGFTPAYILDVIKHTVLPALSVAVSLIGFWTLGMRGIMATVLHEDYLLYAQARGLRPWRIFFSYGIRNAMLPQITAFTLDLGRIISGAVLVEIIFSYPGIGMVLFNALREADYFVIQGIVLFIIVSVALAALLIDLIYPKLDPRIKYD
jgi:peptide/nickel transport system permease protein